MRSYVDSGKKRFWRTLLLCHLIVTLLAPSAHSHESWYDDSKIHHATATLKTAATHNHADHWAGEWAHENLLTSGAGFHGISEHCHSNHRHFHFTENLLPRPSREIERSEKHESFSPQAGCDSSAWQKVSAKVADQLLPLHPSSRLGFILVATSLPPPSPLV